MVLTWLDPLSPRNVVAGGCRLTVHVLLGRGTTDSVDGDEGGRLEGCGNGRGGGERGLGPLSTGRGRSQPLNASRRLGQVALHPFTLQLLRSQDANAAALGAFSGLFHFCQMMD